MHVCACMHVCVCTAYAPHARCMHGACTVHTVPCMRRRRGVQGLACCTQLEHLDLGHNRIASAANVHTELAQLRLRVVDLQP